MYVSYSNDIPFHKIAKFSPDLRRYVRPLLLSPDGITPGPYKRIYDISGIVLTQITFSYITAPFVILDMRESIIVWVRTYFIIHIGIILSYIYFHSPYGRGFLVKTQKSRQSKLKGKENDNGKHDALLKAKLAMLNASTGDLNQPGPLGVPEDVERDVIEAVRLEIEELKAAGQFEKARLQVESLKGSVEGLRSRAGRG